MKSSILALALSMMLCTVAGASGVPAATVDECLDCHAETGMETTFADGTKVGLTVDRVLFKGSIHGDLTCVDCHDRVSLEDHPSETLGSRPEYRQRLSASCAGCHTEEAEKVKADLHTGLPAPLVCADCHVPHGVQKSGARHARVISCARCHGVVGATFAGSAHGRPLVASGNSDVPDCSDCHGVHQVQRADTPAFHLASVDLCRKCHGDAEKMARYGISTDVLDTYLQDYHGVSVTYRRKDGGAASALAAQGTATPSRQIQATCIDCHGSHAIAARGTDASPAIEENAARMCARCHEGATVSFSKAWLAHKVPSLSRAPMVYAVRVAYMVLIPFMVFGLLTHIGIDLKRQKLHHFHHDPKASGPDHVRFNRWRRSEHLLVIFTFFALVITGLPQKFHDSAWGEVMILAMGGIETTRFAHRVIGVIFAVTAALHIGINLVAILARRMRPSMLFSRKDFTDTLQLARYSLGRADTPPKFDRYDFRQKFEYWGIVMGGSLMILTGFVLMYPATFAALLPGQLIPVAKAAHGFEALLALLVVVIWHIYCVSLSPEVFPLDKAIFTGKISHERMLHEHPLELETGRSKSQP